jgi:hypothetical protein
MGFIESTMGLVEATETTQGESVKSARRDSESSFAWQERGRQFVTEVES